MTFKEYVEALARELRIDIEIEDNTCAVSLEEDDYGRLIILLHGFDERNSLLTYADLGNPPPEGKERLYQTLLEANDLYGNTAGATLSLDPETGHVRIQRFDDLDTLFKIGPAKTLIAFADTAAAWQKLIHDYRNAPTEGVDDALTPSDSIRV